MELRPNHQFNPFASDDELAQYDLPDLDFDKMDFSDPATMSKLLGMDVPHKSPAEVRKEAESLSSSLLASYDCLQAIIARHEPAIHHRWSRKKRHQRLDTLTRAWGPGMASVHRPDFDAWRKQESSLAARRSTYDRDCFMWPYINQEDLLKPKTLLLLLNARGRHHPSEFAGADYDAMHLGCVTKRIVAVFLNCYVMILHGARDAREYGKLVAWEDHPDAFEWMHSRRQFMPGEGLLILEAQERTLSFLVKCCELILHDIPSDTLATDAFPVQPEPEFKNEQEADGFDSLAAMAAEAPYRLPARLDLDRIQSLLGAKVAAARDHIWSLREDPGYFAEQLAEIKEHRQEMIKDINGSAHPTLSRLNQETFWARVVAETVARAYEELEVYTQLHELASELRGVLAAHAGSIDLSKDLPDEVMNCLLKFRFFLNEAAKGPLGQLKQSVVASPPMRRFVTRDPPVNATFISIKMKGGVKMNKIETQLMWLLRTLWEDGQNLFLASMPLVLDELERLLHAEPQAKELVSPYIASVIGNLSIISQCISQLDLYQPWARSYESKMVDRGDVLKAEFAMQTTGRARVMAVLKESNLLPAARLAEPSNNRFTYPSEKRRTKAITATLIEAERNVDAVWATVDRLIREKAGGLWMDAVRHVLEYNRSLQRTPKWVDEPEATGEKKPKPTDVQTDMIYRPLSTLYFEKSGEAAQDVTRPPKTKKKTKGAASQDLAETSIPTADADASNEPVSSPICVDARSFKVFRTLFFDPNVTSHPGQVSWKDFLHAMTGTGIFAAEKLYGSVWQFERTDGDQSRIQFHEPHPYSKIPFVVARRIGRRLNRNYGWTGDMFVLKGTE
ncbi:hypothetical protein CGCS363_v013026 [Colletotrichum siamense]|uniref:uncharacterized protein n=1 Tax=Colletotrichum siamense TaxID=690259 RepID=UPI001872E14F|nr:uncharacterized protein CGCS363_v013026 [Colletotrichum siamense]KAF5487168.1 hypothetical protein CGCS363_v013026 [Colletotrichum siamense]